MDANLCRDCPDREACLSGWTCESVVRANNKRTNSTTRAHVPPTPHAHENHSQVREPLGSDPFTEAVSAELVACTLGERERLELRVDPPARLIRQLRWLRERLSR